MDKVLVPYLTARDDREREQHLDELLTLCAAPIVRRVLLRRLGFFVSAQGVNENNQDAEDLYQEAMTRVVQELTQRPSSTAADIENFELYVARLAGNVCIDFLRAKSPARTRLKYNLRDLLKRHKDLAAWHQHGELLCGFEAWRHTEKSPFSDSSYDDIEEKLHTFQLLHFPGEDVRLAPVSQIIAELFNWIGAPVDIDVLVRLVASLLDIKDQPIESLDDPVSSESPFHVLDTRSGESHVEANELLARLWRAVIHLPREQRDAFAFGFEDETGQDLFTALIAAEVATWDELAQGMSRSVAEVVRLRLRMPMDSAGLADELGTSRENVYKWRFRAIRRLKTELRV